MDTEKKTADLSSAPARLRLRTILATIVAASLIALVSSVSVAEMTQYDNPALGLRFAPWNARANATLADVLQQRGGDNARIESLATTALSRSPISATALRVKGFVAERRGQPGRAGSLMATAERLSRRELGTQLWLINAATARGDVAGALNHFDYALRTSLLARDILFPILAGAMTDPELRPSITRLLARRGSWVRDFFISSIQNDLAVTELYAAARVAGIDFVSSDRELGALLVKRLITVGNFVAARSIGWPSSDQAVVDSNFATGEGFDPFQWHLINGSGRGAERTPDGLSVFSDRGEGGIVAEQLLVLAAGQHRLKSASNGFSKKSGTVVWRLTCLGDDRQIATLDFKDMRREESLTVFSVPPQCKAQWLRLSVQGDPAGPGVVGSVRNVVVKTDR